MRSKYFLISVFFLGLLLRVAYFLTIPLGEAPDEKYHFERIYYTAVKYQYPAGIESHTEDFPNHTYYYNPPLYYWLWAALIAPQLTKPLKPTLEAFAIFGKQLRILSFIVSIITITLSLILIGSLYPKIVVLTSVIFLLFPQWISSAFWVNSDPLFLLLIILTLGLGIKFLDTPYQDRHGLALGTLTAVTMLTKVFGSILFFGLVIGIITTQVWQRNKARALIIFTLTTAILTSWWYLQNYLLTGSFLAVSKAKLANESFTQPFSFPYYPLAVAWWTTETFIASFGPTNNIRLPTSIYLILSLMIFFFLLQLKNSKIREELLESNRKKVFIFMLSTMTAVSLLHLAIINSTISFQPQGRYLYPLFILFPILIAIGALNLRPQGSGKVLTFITAVTLIILNLWGLNCVTSRYQNVNFLPKSMACTHYEVRLPPWEEPLKLKEIQ